MQLESIEPKPAAPNYDTLKDSYYKSESVLKASLSSPLDFITPALEGNELREIFNWVKSPAGQKIFSNGVIQPMDKIAQLLVFLQRKGLLASEMPELPAPPDYSNVSPLEIFNPFDLKFL